MDYASGDFVSNPDSLGEVLEPQSPLMADVASLNATNALRSTASVVAGRGVVVARWAGGGQEPLVLRGTRGNRTLVEFNFWLLSSSVDSSWWTGDGGALLRNGLKYSRCIPCGMGTYTVDGEEGGSLCVRASVPHRAGLALSLCLSLFLSLSLSPSLSLPLSFLPPPPPLSHSITVLERSNSKGY